ncbi:hypothetical protein SNARM312S_06759 [Streptomyces narbonensis]
MDAQHSHHLLCRLRHPHRDQRARVGVRVQEGFRDPGRPPPQIPVPQQVAVGRHHRHPVRLALGPAHHPVGQRRRRSHRTVRRVHPGHELVQAGTAGIRAARPRPGVDQTVEQAAVGVEHLVPHAGQERVARRVPVELQRPGVLVHLMVQKHLRGLRNAQRGPAEPVLAQRSGVPTLLVPALVAGAGEDHRAVRDTRGRARSGQLPLYRHPVERAVFQVAPQLPVQPVGQFGDAGAAAEVHFEQDHAGEVADQSIDVRMHRAPAEQRQVQQESVARGPAPEHGREGREQHRRRGELVLSRQLPDA